MTEARTWHRWTAAFEQDTKGVDTAVLPALRRGLNREAGTVPEMWPYYTALDEDGHLTRALKAEHVCLVVFAVHQQGRGYAVHRSGARLGEALRTIRYSERFGADAVDERVGRLATAGDLGEVQRHLTSLIQLSRAVRREIRLDYDQLCRDLTSLQYERSAGAVRRRWGAAYFRPEPEPTKEK